MQEKIKDRIDKDQLYIDIANTIGGLKPETVKAICEKQFHKTAQMINEGKEDCVKLPYMGKIYKKYNPKE
jgi:hypothetical protein